MICTFFGHRDSPSDIHDRLKLEIKKLIEYGGADTFYVGNHGEFDKLVTLALKELKREFTHINYYVVLAYIPQGKQEDFDERAIVPEGIETVPKKFAIEYRNNWMVKKADYAIIYVNHNFGGAAKFARLAKNKCKKVINLAN